MARTRRVTSSERALLEVALQDVGSRERVLAENAHVRPVTGVYQGK